ncbi:hypothetical protein ACJX0J_032995, partial [Zea mays]
RDASILGWAGLSWIHIKYIWSSIPLETYKIFHVIYASKGSSELVIYVSKGSSELSFHLLVIHLGSNKKCLFKTL